MNKILDWIAGHPLVSAGIVFSFLLLPLLISFISTYGKTEVDLVIAPSDATITIDGERGANGINHLAPGDYIVVAAHEGFESSEISITVTEAPLQVPLSLKPVSDAAWRLIQEDDRFLEVEGLAGRQAQEDGREIRSQHPIINHLPYRSLIFNIDYRLDNNEDELVLIITAETEADREYARAQIENWGYNIDDFLIEYRN
ncbi:MAG: hypothetical protein WD467_02065 [Candidatus Saccharimonadales bacterium]